MTVAVLFYLGALLQLITAVFYLVLAFRPGQVQQFFGHPISDLYWIFTAVLAFVLALIYAWIARRQVAGDPQAWMLVNILAIINIFFAFFEIMSGTGWLALLVNLLALVVNNSTASRRYFDMVGGFGQKPPGAV